MPTKRKRSSLATATAPANNLPPFIHETPILPPISPTTVKPSATKRQTSRKGKIDTNPDHNADIVDGKTALRASPDADEKGEALDIEAVNGEAPLTKPAKTYGVKRVKKDGQSDSALSDVGTDTPAKKQKKSPSKSSIAAKKGSDEIKAFKAEQTAKNVATSKVKMEEGGDEWDKRADPDGDDVAPTEDIDIMRKEAKRPPPVNSDYLPLPWKGRLGYVSLLIRTKKSNTLMNGY